MEGSSTWRAKKGKDEVEGRGREEGEGEEDERRTSELPPRFRPEFNSDLLLSLLLRRVLVKKHCIELSRVSERNIRNKQERRRGKRSWSRVDLNHHPLLPPLLLFLSSLMLSTMDFASTTGLCLLVAVCSSFSRSRGLDEEGSFEESSSPPSSCLPFSLLSSFSSYPRSSSETPSTVWLPRTTLDSRRLVKDSRRFVIVVETDAESMSR